MALRTDQLQSIKTEISKPAYSGLTDTEVAAKLNAVQTITNSIPQESIVIYNASGTTDPAISATMFLNLIPIAELAALKANAAGAILYDRLIGIESKDSKNGILDVTKSPVLQGVAYCLSQGIISPETANLLVGLETIPDPNYKATFQAESMAKQLIFRPVTVDEVIAAREV